MQKELARDITVRVHSQEDYEAALEASEILFGKGTAESLKRLPEATLLSVFEGVPTFEIHPSELESGLPIVDFLAEKTAVFPSKSEARRMLKDGGVLINKQKASEETVVGHEHLLNGRYILVQRGKKNYYLITLTGSQPLAGLNHQP